MKNSIESILKFPLVPINIWDKMNDRLPFNKVSSTDEIISNLEFFHKEFKSGSKIAELILLDFKYFINHPQLSKRKTTATTIEERLSYLFGGALTDKNSRTNPRITELLNTSDIKLIPIESQEKICSNFREKGDILFLNNYKISVKSLMPDNKEINFGAFQYNTLFKGILPEDLLNIGERKNQVIKTINNNQVRIGRGSREQLKNLFIYIKSLGKWDQFVERWSICFKGVFKEDIIIYLKHSNKFEMHLIENSSFVNLISKSLDNEKDKQIINRWEGNSIRMDRSKIIENSTYSIKIDISELKNESTFKKKLLDIDIQKSKLLF